MITPLFRFDRCEPAFILILPRLFRRFAHIPSSPSDSRPRVSSLIGLITLATPFDIYHHHLVRLPLLFPYRYRLPSGFISLIAPSPMACHHEAASQFRYFIFPHSSLTHACMPAAMPRCAATPWLTLPIMLHAFSLSAALPPRLMLVIFARRAFRHDTALPHDEVVARRRQPRDFA